MFIVLPNAKIAPTPTVTAPINPTPANKALPIFDVTSFSNKLATVSTIVPKGPAIIEFNESFIFSLAADILDWASKFNSAILSVLPCSICFSSSLACSTFPSFFNSCIRFWYKEVWSPNICFNCSCLINELANSSVSIPAALASASCWITFKRWNSAKLPTCLNTSWAAPAESPCNAKYLACSKFNCLLVNNSASNSADIDDSKLSKPLDIFCACCNDIPNFWVCITAFPIKSGLPLYWAYNWPFTLATSVIILLLDITPLFCLPIELTISSWVLPVIWENLAKDAASSLVKPNFLVKLVKSSNVLPEKSTDVPKLSFNALVASTKFFW